MAIIRAALTGLAIAWAVTTCGDKGKQQKVDEAAPTKVEENGVRLPPPTCMGKPVPEEKRCDMI